MQTKFQRDGVKLTWQERWALRLIRKQKPVWFTKLVDHWWMFLFIGLLASLQFWVHAYGVNQWRRDLSDSLTQENLETKVEDPWLTDYFKAVLLGNEAFWAFTFLAIMIIIYFGIIGLIVEERKGTRRLIERYEAELKKDTEEG